MLLISGLAACGRAEPAPPAPDTAPAAAVAPSADSTPAALRPHVNWYGMYLQDQKIGWMRDELSFAADTRYTLPAPERDHCRLQSASYMRLPTMGMVQESEMTLTVDFTRGLKPLGFAFSLATPAQTTQVEGEVRGEELVTRMSSPGGVRENRYPLTPDMDLMGLAEMRRAIAGYKIGDVIEGKLYEPTFLGLVPYRIEVFDTALFQTGATSQPVFKVKTTMEGIEAVSWVTPEGEVLRLDQPMGLRMLRESERLAKDLTTGAGLADIYLAFAVPADTVIEAPAAIRRAVLLVEGLGDLGLPTDGTQSLSTGESGSRVIIDLARKPRRPDSFAEWLASAPDLDLKDSRIVAAAKAIVGEERDPEKRARLLSDWVHANLEKEPTFTLPAAVDVLLSKKGDCNEHATLYCALARSSGLATRVMAGVVYMNGRFYYHAWNEVWLKDRWVPVDPTFHEFPAGALRLALAAGGLPSQLRLAAVVGRLKIRILEAER